MLTHKPKPRYIPVSLEGLNEKLDFEIKRLVREHEDGISRYVSKTAVLNGVSTLIFKHKDGAKMTLAYQLDKSGTLRFAREKQAADAVPAAAEKPAFGFGRASHDITS
jgi:hypothetical protein